MHTKTIMLEQAKNLLGHGFKLNLPSWSLAWTFDGLGQPLLGRSSGWGENANLSRNSCYTHRVSVSTQPKAYYLSLEGVVWSTTDDANFADVSSRCGEHPFADCAKTACAPGIPPGPLHIALQRDQAK